MLDTQSASVTSSGRKAMCKAFITCMTQHISSETTITDWLQVLFALAGLVIAGGGLWFVWAELNNSAASLRMSNDYEVHRAVSNALKDLAASDAFVEAFKGTEEGFESEKVTPDASAPLQLFLAELRIARIVFLQDDNEGLSNEFWLRQVKSVCALLQQHPRIKAYWQYRISHGTENQRWDQGFYDEISGKCL